jgi:hypothetical protein
MTIRLVGKGPEIIVEDVNLKLKQVKVEFDKAVEDERAAMVARTQAGRKIDGGDMKPYTKKYKEAKQRLKRSGDVDLTLTGHMLNAITHKIKIVGETLVATIFFANTSRAAPRVPPATKRGRSARRRLKKEGRALKPIKPVLASVKAAANNAIRPFFGFSQEQIARIQARLQSIFSK